MADYDLGTAHGKVVIEYKDTGTGKAAKDLDGLKARAKALLEQFKETSSKYATQAKSMAAGAGGAFARLSAAKEALSARARTLDTDIARLSRSFGIFAGAVATAIPLITRSGSAAGGASHLLQSFRFALGDVPKGAEGFPNVVKRIIQISAAVSLFHASTSLLATVTSRFRLLGAVGGLVGKFGGTINRLAGPLHAVAGIAGRAATTLLAFRLVKSLIKPLLAFGGALAATGGALHLISGLATAIADLSGLIGLLPAVAGAAVFGMAALKIGVSGFGDAMKAVGDPAKFAEAIKKLTPAAQEAAKAVQGLQDNFKTMRDDLQERLFEGLGQQITAIGEKYLPTLNEQLGRVTDVVNSAAVEIGNYLQTAEGFNQVKAILIDYSNTWENLVVAVPHLTRALLDVIEVGADVFKGLTEGAGRAAEGFANFIRKAKDTGKLREWMMAGVQAFKDLIAIIGNVGSALQGIWKGLNGGEATSFLATLREMTNQFRMFVRSAEGQKILGLIGQQMQTFAEHAQKLGEAFITYVLPALEKFLPIMSQLSGATIDGVVEALKVLGPIFYAIAAVLTPLAPVLAIIVKHMVFLAVTAAGLGIAFKIVSGALLILKVGLNTVTTAFKVAGFAARLFTGNLSATEAKAAKLATTLAKKLPGAIRTFVGSSKLLKAGGIVAGLAAITVAADNLLPPADQSKITNSVLGGIPDYTNAARDDLHEFANFVRGMMNDPAAEVKRQWEDIKGEFASTGTDFANSPAKRFIDSIGPTLQGLPGKIKGWLSGMGASFHGAIIQPLIDAGKAIGDFFTVTIPGFFTGLPGKISSWLSGVGPAVENPFSGIGTTIQEKFNGALEFIKGLPGKIGGFLSSLGPSLATKASEAWTSFKTATETKFNELGGTVGSLPYRLGVAIGSLIGIALKWGLDTWEAFKQGTITKFNELMAWLATVPARVSAFFVGLAATISTWAVTTWNSVYTWAVTKWNEIVTFLTGLPARIGTALSSLGSTLVTMATNAWNSFYSTTSQWVSQAIAYVSALPGRIGAAISSLAATLRDRAVAAWNSFYATAVDWGNRAIAFAQGLPGRVGSAISSLVATLRERATAAWQSFLAACQSGIQTAVSFVQGLPGRITAALGNLGGLLMNAGRSIMDGLLSGIKSGVQGVYDFVSGIGAGIASRKGPIPYDLKLLVPAGGAIIKGLHRGLAQELPVVYKMVGGVGDQIASALSMSAAVNLNGSSTVSTSLGTSAAPYTGPFPAGGDGASSPVTNNYNVTIPASDIAEMKSVADFFGKVQQKARAGKASS